MNTTLITVPLLYRNASLKSYAHQLATQFKLTLATKHNKRSKWLLNLDEHGLQLQNHDNRQTLMIQFDQGALDHRRRFSNGRKQPLSKAVGLDKARELHILDATAGFGRDAFMMASLGAQVTLLERNPIIAALLFDALKRATLCTKLHDVIENMKLISTNSHHYLTHLPTNKSPDIIYMDPMYPERKKSALVKKDMQAAHEIVGKDEDAVQVLTVARETAKKRVVVKRPKGADALGGQKASTSIQVKNTRYDIYSNRKLDEHVKK